MPRGVGYIANVRRGIKKALSSKPIKYKAPRDNMRVMSPSEQRARQAKKASRSAKQSHMKKYKSSGRGVGM